MTVAVIGAGSWGTAIAQTLANAGNEVVMWARKPEVAQCITEEHRNPRYLITATLHDSISATSDLEVCLKGAESVVVVIPSRLVRQFANEFKGLVTQETPIVICSKGVEEGTSLLPLQVFDEVLGNRNRLAVLSGPNHAEEVVFGVPSGTVIASPSLDTAEYFRSIFNAPTFRCYVSTDYLGVEICAAYKNIIAIAVGAAYGVGAGDNTTAMIITRGMAEMSRLVKACGGEAMTVMGLAGAGDLIATCMSEHSRNRRFGQLLSMGGTVEQFEQETHMVVEGALASKTICPLAARYNVELPIATIVRESVWEHQPISVSAELLRNRPLTTEFWGLTEQA